jgi:hypothetical protein
MDLIPSKQSKADSQHLRLYLRGRLYYGSAVHVTRHHHHQITKSSHSINAIGHVTRVT